MLQWHEPASLPTLDVKQNSLSVTLHTVYLPFVACEQPFASEEAPVLLQLPAAQFDGILNRNVNAVDGYEVRSLLPPPFGQPTLLDDLPFAGRLHIEDVVASFLEVLGEELHHAGLFVLFEQCLLELLHLLGSLIHTLLY